MSRLNELVQEELRELNEEFLKYSGIPYPSKDDCRKATLEFYNNEDPMEVKKFKMAMLSYGMASAREEVIRQGGTEPDLREARELTSSAYSTFVELGGTLEDISPKSQPSLREIILQIMGRKIIKDEEIYDFAIWLEVEPSRVQIVLAFIREEQPLC